ncbi:hypothetical protein IMZ48_27695 [Candidatus Bathyarchaeota archaeon]|nr:hypothetical protein [Candidatus Bathyarchaeota archaeon]
MLSVEPLGEERDAVGLGVGVKCAEGARGDCPDGEDGDWVEGDGEGRGAAPGVGRTVVGGFDGVPAPAVEPLVSLAGWLEPSWGESPCVLGDSPLPSRCRKW